MLRTGNGDDITLQMGSGGDRLNAQTVDLVSEAPGVQRRAVGYLPGQALTVEGAWEGGLLTARACYADTVEDDRAQTVRQPGTALLGGLACGGLGFGPLIAAIVLRILGRQGRGIPAGFTVYHGSAGGETTWVTPDPERNASPLVRRGRRLPGAR